MSGGGASGGSGNDRETELRLWNERQAREERAAEEERSALEAAWNARRGQLQGKFSQYSIPDAEMQIGGTAGEFIRLAKLQPESLAGVVIMQFAFFAFSLLINKQWMINQRMYQEACAAGFGYDGSQTIYKIGEDGKPDFTKPYGPGEDIPTEVIVANGYMVEKSVVESWFEEFVKFTEQQAGPNVIPQEYLAEVYGPQKAAQMKGGRGRAGMDQTAEDLEARRRMTKGS